MNAQRRHRILLGSALCLLFAVPVSLGLRLAIAETSTAVIVLCIFATVIFAAVPGLLKITGSVTVGGVALIGGLFVLVAGIGYFAGGLAAPALMAAPLLPVLAFFLLESRFAALAVTSLTLVTVALFALLPVFGVDFPRSPLTDVAEMAARGVVLIVTIVAAGFFVALSERQRIDAEARLRRSEEAYRRIFEQSKDAVTVSTPDGRLVDVNSAGVELFGAGSREELLARPLAESYADPDERRVLLDRLAKDGWVSDYETVHRRPSGELRVLSGTTSTIRGEDGSVELLFAILRDVTDRRQAAAEREALLADLAAKNAELERFAAAASHDLKSPLTTIRGYVGLLKKVVRSGDTTQVETFASTIHRAIENLARMIDGFLRLSRIGHQGVSRSVVTPGEVAQEAAELLAEPIRAAGASVVIAPDLPEISADRTLLLAIFQNLIDNGVKFSSGGPQPPVVKVAWRRGEAGEVVLTVTDNGIGVRPSDCERIFALFEHVDSNGGGTGIGLATVRRAVEVQDGRVWVESEGEEGGSTFCFTLSAGQAAAGSGSTLVPLQDEPPE